MDYTLQRLKEQYIRLSEDVLPGGKADDMSLRDIFNKHKIKYKNLKYEDIVKEFEKGVKVEMEHTNNVSMAKEITKDHLSENDPFYYTNLEKIHLD